MRINFQLLFGCLFALTLIGCFSKNENGGSSPKGDGPVFSSKDGKKTDKAQSSKAGTPSKTSKKQRSTKEKFLSPTFSEVAQESGIKFTYFNDNVKDRFYFPEIMGGGLGWIDFDNDGLLDLYAVNGCQLENPGAGDHRNQLFRNIGDGKFEQVTQAPIADDPLFGHGCSIGDFNTDGFQDIFVTNYGANTLWENNGDGTFTQIQFPNPADITNNWSAGSIWLDMNRDGHLDLYVMNYIHWNPTLKIKCSYSDLPGYCGPGRFDPSDDRVYLNDGQGNFYEAENNLGCNTPTKALCIIGADLDDDQIPEVYVGSDLTANVLYCLDQSDPDKLQYVDNGDRSGLAYNSNGKVEASMGIACRDFDGNGKFDIFLTHYFNMKNTMYLNIGNLMFNDDSQRSRIVPISMEYIGFGTVPIDYDNNGVSDLFITNGHVLGPNQPNFRLTGQIWHNNGKSVFTDISSTCGAYFSQKVIGRGAAMADYDNDHDVDVAVSHLLDPAALLRNDTKHKNRAITLDIRTHDRTDATGAKVIVTTSDMKQIQQVVSGGSYMSENDRRLSFGIGNALSADVEIFWPDGKVDQHKDLASNKIYMVRPEFAQPLPN